MLNAALITACAVSSAAAVPTLTPVSTRGELYITACAVAPGFWDCEDDRIPFNNSGNVYQFVHADLDDPNGGDIADASGTYGVGFGPSVVDIEYVANASVTGAGYTAADAGYYAETLITVSLSERALVRFLSYVESFYPASYPAYFAYGNASLRESGGAVVATVGQFGEGEAHEDSLRWLPAGTYTVFAEFDANATFGNPAWGGLGVNVSAYETTDANTDGVTDASDLTAFTGAYAAGDADYNGDGVTDSADLSEFVADWIAASSS